MTRERESVMRTSAIGTSGGRLCAALVAALAIFAGPRPGAALSPAPDLPPGTFHELRITSLTALTVAQQITQPAICGNGNACLHNEIRIAVNREKINEQSVIGAHLSTDDEPIR